MSKHPKKRYISLLEVLIGMGLALIVLTTLTFFYQQVTSLNAVMDQVQKESFQLRFLENRLTHVLPRAVSEKSSKKDFFFFTSGDAFGLLHPGLPSLIFTFNNNTDIDKDFSNHVIGRLFVDKQNRLCLAYWSSQVDWDKCPNPPLKKEILLDNVSDLAFKFYVAPDKPRKTEANSKQTEVPVVDPKQVDPKLLNSRQIDPKNLETKQPEPKRAEPHEPEPKGGWLTLWKAEYHQLPVMIRIEIKRKVKDTEEMILFVLPLLNSNKNIVYDR